MSANPALEPAPNATMPLPALNAKLPSYSTINKFALITAVKDSLESMENAKNAVIRTATNAMLRILINALNANPPSSFTKTNVLKLALRLLSLKVNSASAAKTTAMNAAILTPALNALLDSSSPRETASRPALKVNSPRTANAKTAKTETARDAIKMEELALLAMLLISSQTTLASLHALSANSIML